MKAYTKQQRFAVEISVLAAISELADKQEITLSQLINTALKQYIERQD